MIILYLLSQGTHRFNELNKKMSDMSQTTLTTQLRSLEKSGLIERIVYPEIPPKVEYKLSDLGREFESVLESINDFGMKYISYLKKGK
jgi:DNA-binding HxlR family transcriptional regulator